MKFKSTRGGVAGVSFEEAVLCGCASDGGLFMPESLPEVSPEQLKAWASLSYPQLVHQLLRLCVDPQEMSDQELKGRSVNLWSASFFPHSNYWFLILRFA